LISTAQLVDGLAGESKNIPCDIDLGKLVSHNVEALSDGMIRVCGGTGNPPWGIVVAMRWYDFMQGLGTEFAPICKPGVGDMLRRYREIQK